MNADLDNLADLPAVILGKWGEYLTSGTIAANTVLALVIALLAGWLAAMVPAPRGPLHVCACGRPYRQGGRESHRAFEARRAEHFDTCAVLNGARR